MYITRLESKKIFSPSNKIHREVGRAKDLSALMYLYIYVYISVALQIRNTDICMLTSYITCTYEETLWFYAQILINMYMIHNCRKILHSTPLHMVYIRW